VPPTYLHTCILIPHLTGNGLAYYYVVGYLGVAIPVSTGDHPQLATAVVRIGVGGQASDSTLYVLYSPKCRVFCIRPSVHAIGASDDVAPWPNCDPRPPIGRRVMERHVLRRSPAFTDELLIPYGVLRSRSPIGGAKTHETLHAQGAMTGPGLDGYSHGVPRCWVRVRDPIEVPALFMAGKVRKVSPVHPQRDPDLSVSIRFKIPPRRRRRRLVGVRQYERE
jgi:hypothetical protein